MREGGGGGVVGLIACRHRQPLWALMVGGLIAPALALAGPGMGRAAAAPAAGPTVTVTCPNLGTMVVALPSGVTTPPLPSEVTLSVGYRGRDARTGATVSGGQVAGDIQCDPVPFTKLAASDVSGGALPPGVAPTDQLTGSWTVSVTVSSSPVMGPHAAAAATSDPFVSSLQSYLATRADSAAVAVFDAKTGATYTVAPQNSYVTASIVKADILATLLRQTQQAGRGLTSQEQSTATRMIEISDNSAATALWNEVGGGSGVASFNSGIPLPHTVPGSGGLWGLTRTTAPDQVALVKNIVYPSSLLGAGQQAYEQGLMENVTPSQRWGVSGGVPGGVSVALKNGWLPVSGGWEINSIGHIAGAGKDYVIAVLTSGNSSMSYGISTIQGVASLVWSGLPTTTTASLKRPAVGRKGDGSLEVFATSGGRLLTSWQSGAGGPFGGWLDFGVPAVAVGVPAVAVQHNGGLQVFVHTSDDRVLTSWQATAATPFGGWLDLGLDGQLLGDPAVGVSSSGAMSLFVLSSGVPVKGHLLTSWQSGPGQPFGGWLDFQSLSESAVGVAAVATQANGGLQVFVHTDDNRLVTSWQPGLGQPFGGWLGLGLDGQILGDPAVGVSGGGAMSVLVAGAGGRMVTSWQSTAGAAFGGWLDLGVPATVVGVPAVGVEASGGLEVFTRTSDHRLLTSWQSGVGAPFGGWLDLGADGAIGSDAGVGVLSGGALGVFVRSVAGSTLTAVQTGPSQPFTGFIDLAMPH
jgi:beta-lactamase class A